MSRTLIRRAAYAPRVTPGPPAPSPPETVACVQPGSYVLPALQGGVQVTVPAATLFPTLTIPAWVDMDFFNAPGTTGGGPIDPTSLSGIETPLRDYQWSLVAKDYDLSSNLKKGCSYQVEIWGEYWTFGLDEECQGVPLLRRVTPGAVLIETIFCTVFPVIQELPSVLYLPGQQIDYVCSWWCMTPPGTMVEMHPYGCGATFIKNATYRVVAQNCNDPPAGGSYQSLVSIPAPVAPTIPAAIPLPVLQATVGLPNFIGGTVTPAAPGSGGTVNLVPGPNNTVTLNVSMPNCSCTDGQSPTLATGAITSNQKLPVSATIRQVGTYAYVVDMNLPPSVVPFVALNMTLPVYDTASDADVQTPVLMYVPSDGTNDMKTAIGWIIEQIIELRAAINPNVKVVSPAQIQGP